MLLLYSSILPGKTDTMFATTHLTNAYTSTDANADDNTEMTDRKLIGINDFNLHAMYCWMFEGNISDLVNYCQLLSQYSTYILFHKGYLLNIDNALD